MKTGGPNCPPHVRFAKRIYRKIVEATDGSTGGSDLEDDLEGDDEDNEVEDDGEEGYEEDFPKGVLDVGEGGGEDNNGRGVPHPPEFPPTQIDLENEGGGNTPSMTSRDTLSARMGGSTGAKRLASSSQSGGRAAKKTSKGFSQPLQIPRRSPTYSDKSDDGDGNDGYSFGNIKSMMMMQNRFDNTQRERQYQKESELREQEFQLCCKETEIAREEARAQRQMMNVMMMAMLNRNGGGDNSNPPPSPSKQG